MSMPREQKITCPQCGKEIEFTMWESINTEMDFAIPDIISGKLFEIECKNCGLKTHIVYPILFNDLERNVWIWLQPDFDGEDADGMLKMTKSMGTRIRIVLTQEDLREKTAILNAGLDDRLVELAKIFLRAQIDSQLEGKEVEKVFLNITENGFLWELVIDGKSQLLEAPSDMFDELAEQLQAELPSPEEEPYVIDSEWALQFLEGNMPEE